MTITEEAFATILDGCDRKEALWERILRTSGASTVAEIGVWKGDYAQHLLQHCSAIERYYMIDPWRTLPDWNKPYNVSPETFDKCLEETMAKTEFAASKRVILRGRTKEVIDRIPDNSLDFAYLDGDHTLRGITIDLISVLPKIKEGGLIGGDDFLKNPWRHHSRAYEPTLVCPFSVYFAEAMDLPIRALPFTQFVIEKNAEALYTFIDTANHYSQLSMYSPPVTARRVVKGAVKSILKSLGWRRRGRGS